MIPLYPPHAGPPAFGRPRWRSLVHLITPNHSRRASFDLQEGEDGEGRQRRPSAPAVLHDLRRILPGYVHRRYHSSSALLQATTEEEEEELSRAPEFVVGGHQSKSFLPLQQHHTIGAEPARRQSLSQLFLPLVSLQHQQSKTAAATSETITGGRARFKCKRIKAARESDPRTEEQGVETTTTTRTAHHFFKSKAKDSSRGFWQAHRKVSSVSLAATSVVVQSSTQASSSSQLRGAFEKKHSFGGGGGAFCTPNSTTSCPISSQKFSTCSSYVRSGGNENWTASTLSSTSLLQQPSEQINLQKQQQGNSSGQQIQPTPLIQHPEGIQNQKTVFQQHKGFFAKLLEEHKSRFGNPRKVSSAAEVVVADQPDHSQPLPEQEDFAEVTVVAEEQPQQEFLEPLPVESIPLQLITYISNSLSAPELVPSCTPSPPKAPLESPSLPEQFFVTSVEATYSPPPSQQSLCYLEDKTSQEEVFQKASTSANDDSSASNCGCGRFLLTDQRRRHRHRSDSTSNFYRPAAVAATQSSKGSGSSSVKVVSTRPKVKLFSEGFSGPSSSPPSPPKSRRKGVVVEEPNDSLYIRRHTIPDMTVAAYGMVICGTDEQQRYRGRIEKVKFGVPISEAFSHDIPATLLVLLLKVNKEGPLKKDIWRAPGNQAQVRKLSHIMQHGRLVNISNISVYTAASVIKKFLAKLPGGIFGVENEKQLFSIMQQPDDEAQRQVFCRVICSLSVPSQHLLVLLFGTFRIITDSAETFATRMTPDAVGISVAPSLFHTCIHDGQRAKLEDVMRFKMASQVISKIIQGFGYTNLFPRECYEFYARITGRTLRVDEHWHFTFQYPSRTFSQPSIRCNSQSPQPTTSRAAAQIATAAEECEDEDVYGESLPELSHYVRVVHRQGAKSQFRSLDDPVGGHMLSQARLSTSMGEVVVHSEDEGDMSSSASTKADRRQHLESTRSLTYLEWVHEKQTRRMHSRSEWFLSPPTMPVKNNGASKSADFPAGRFSSPMHLKLPKQEEDLLTSSGDEDMSSVFGGSNSFGGQVPSTSSSMKCSPRPPSSGGSKMSVEVAKGPPSPEPISPLSRKPFQLLQQRQYSSTEGSESATPPASAGAAPDSMSKTFFGLTDQQASGQQQILADDFKKGEIAPSEGSSSSGASTVATAIAAIGLQSGEVASRAFTTSGVVRRRSWRTHYIRPNKSLECDSGIVKEEIAQSSQSTPLGQSPSSRRNSGPNGGGPGITTSIVPTSTRTALIRRKSSGNGGSSTSTKPKTAVQSRKSTQL